MAIFSAGMAKSSPLKNLANFLTTIESYYIKKIYTLITHTRKSGKFYCIMYRINKTMLPWIMAAWQFWRYQK